MTLYGKIVFVSFFIHHPFAQLTEGHEENEEKQISIGPMGLIGPIRPIGLIGLMSFLSRLYTGIVSGHIIRPQDPKPYACRGEALAKTDSAF